MRPSWLLPRRWSPDARPALLDAARDVRPVLSLGHRRRPGVRARRAPERTTVRGCARTRRGQCHLALAALGVRSSSAWPWAQEHPTDTATPLAASCGGRRTCQFPARSLLLRRLAVHEPDVTHRPRRDEVLRVSALAVDEHLCRHHRLVHGHPRLTLDPVAPLECRQGQRVPTRRRRKARCADRHEDRSGCPSGTSAVLAAAVGVAQRPAGFPRGPLRYLRSACLSGGRCRSSRPCAPGSSSSCPARPPAHPRR